MSWHSVKVPIIPELREFADDSKPGLIITGAYYTGILAAICDGCGVIVVEDSLEHSRHACRARP